jgi:hypothetical protein
MADKKDKHTPEIGCGEGRKSSTESQTRAANKETEGTKAPMIGESDTSLNKHFGIAYVLVSQPGSAI